MGASLHPRVVRGPGGGAGVNGAVEGAAAVGQAPMTAGARLTAPRATRRCRGATRRCWGATVSVSPTTLSWMVSAAPRGVGARVDSLVVQIPIAANLPEGLIHVHGVE